MMTIFGALTFVLVIFEVASVLLPEKIEDGGRGHRDKLATTEMHSFANIGVDKTGATPTEISKIILMKETIFSTALKPAATAALPEPKISITTVAGGVRAGGGGDGGLATSSQLNHPGAVAVDASGDIYIADSDNHVIRMVAKSNGIITTVAGNGYKGYSADGGHTTLAQLDYPRGVAVGTYGNIYIADTDNHRIRVVTKSTGIITTVAGSGTGGYRGDRGCATGAQLFFPRGVAVDTYGNIYIADTKNGRIRVVTKSTGTITTVAGNEQGGFSGDRDYATLAKLRYPESVAVDTYGNIYVSDLDIIRMVAKSTSIITTVAGSGTSGFSGDEGAPILAQVNNPGGIAVDALGNIYIADTGNNRIRKISPIKRAAVTAKKPTA